MSIINSSTTHHNRPGERNFAKQLFIGLAVLVAAAILVAVLVGQKQEAKPAGTATTVESRAAPVSPGSAPEPISEQPKK